MKIYTRRGDEGDTSLFGAGRTGKDDPRVVAYGEVDELNAWLGVARSHCREEEVLEALDRVQRELFVVGAILATPDPDRREGEKFALGAGRVERLEQEIDRWQEELAELKAFVLPGGGLAGAHLHAARAVCRRAERAIVALEADDLPGTLLRYVNRLSDWIFVAARRVNREEGVEETIW
ncbi:MAG: cob(I)yrinic acid a,c-diamide adenosyltransferase [Gemmatimonadota bacterium]|nr:cob(I)yrinic acid a,c-diamide adenosyltransferase [Gemmatimonadota bacterium]